MDKAHICAQCGLGRKNIAGIRSGGHGKGDRCCQHGSRLPADPWCHQLNGFFEQIQMLQCDTEREHGSGSHCLQHGSGRRFHLTAEGTVLFDGADKGRQAGNRGIPAWGAGMSALSPGNEAHIGAPLLPDADHGKVSSDSRHGVRVDPAALITDEPGLHAPSAKFLYNGGTAGASPLLRAGGGEIDILLRNIPFPEQFFHSLKESHAGALGVH